MREIGKPPAKAKAKCVEKVVLASNWLLEDSNRGQIGTPKSVEELESALSRISVIASAPNAILDLIAPSGDYLSVGVSHQTGESFPDKPEDPKITIINEAMACVNFTHDGDENLYLSVVGDKNLSCADGVVIFFYAGQWTEIPRRNCVPASVMMRLRNHFSRRANCRNGSIGRMFNVRGRRHNTIIGRRRSDLQNPLNQIVNALDREIKTKQSRLRGGQSIKCTNGPTNGS